MHEEAASCAAVPFSASARMSGQMTDESGDCLLFLLAPKQSGIAIDRLLNRAMGK